MNREVPNTEPLRQEFFISELHDRMQCLAHERGRYPTYKVVTFGCQMNARDSEKLAGILTDSGFQEGEGEDSDLVLFNTCTVRENANDKLYGRLGQLKKYKEKNPSMIIGICGCMMQEAEEVRRIKKSYPYVDLVFGTHNIYKLAEILDRYYETRKQVVDVVEGSDLIVENLPNKRLFPFKSGVNIMFGCNNFCTYCIVPYVRGREKSREPEDILGEIEGLAAEGVKEVMLLGQNVNSYGRGLEGNHTFASLLREIVKIPGLERLRFMTSHPKDLSQELIEAMAESKKICKHLHLPLQSGSTRILQRMNRVYTKESYLELVERIREKMPDISLTTDIIVGFPGETEEEFADTLDVVKRVRYDSAFTFIYSKRSGTPAAKMEEQVPTAVVKQRFDRLLHMVQEIAAENARKKEKKVFPVLVEGVNDHMEGYLTGRLDNNMTVHFKGNRRLIGEIINVVLDESRGFYYLGHPDMSEV